MKKKISKKDTPLKDRYIGVILEDINDKFDRVLEGHSVLDKKIEDFRYEVRSDIKFVNLTSRTLLQKQIDLEVKINKLEDEMKNSFKSVFDYLSRTDKELESIRALLIERLDKLEKRVARLETSHA